ncbi:MULTISPECIES: DUF1700 domain-containing protein [Lachnospiraceae]|jgi:uncharacterized membrane protein|uniref:DUF1700 domain-containing protein n=1 Tax=Faecalicatena acetigenes TaxID=2981790 RepID=A0ABT2TED8_9FIRM|nr:MULTISPECIES: DUF1700 domain-containing protein [Lachnospiraceae]MCU6748612.1 DUF1700 domain-containing protein [Faecalicatena acetigenes]RGT70392.1 DUF1700 domain-containing protein [Ruminococcus sp. AF18-22]SCI54363.1 Predicted membrane protein [uncultured Clostridium sp.]
MTKKEYMRQLAGKLRRLPKEDYDKALAYFDEYFEEAGPENEQQAITDLGSPEEAAKELIMQLAGQNSKEPPKTMKKGISAVWVGILGVCAAPIALPLALAIIIVAVALLITVFAVLLSLIFSAVAVAAGGILSILGGVILLFRTFPDGLCNLGIGIFALGAGILCIYGTIFLTTWFLRKMTCSLGKITKGGRKK